MDPNELDEYVYVRRTPTWTVRIMYSLALLTWLPILYISVAQAFVDPFYAWFVTPIIIILSLHYLSSFVLVLFYKQFDLNEHFGLFASYWTTTKEPSVDVFLPVCGEDIPTLEHTWMHVSLLNYKNKKVYVLDDSKDELQEHLAMAKRYGFNYFERPNKGEMKKAGNLKYAYERTSGEFIAILDADFAVNKEYLRELIPYMREKEVGIVQSPQYFPTGPGEHKKSPLAYGAGRAQEVFYRIIQPARDRLDGAHCCGTCAIYRRAALASIGGFVQMGHSEDAHTGFGLTANHWIIRYVPLVVSVGLSPSDPHMFFHQQHRWCLGNIIMMLDPKFWRAKISWKIKYCYVTGFLFYTHQPFLVLLSFQLFWVLIFDNHHIALMAGLPFYPHIIWAFSYMFLFYIAPFEWGYLYAIILRTYAYCHASATALLGKTVGWIPTGSKQSGVSSAFRETVVVVSIYVLCYVELVFLTLRMNLFHFGDYNYLSIEFWILYNLGLTCVLLLGLYKTLEGAKKRQLVAEHEPTNKIYKWHAKVAGSYFGIILIVGVGVFYVPSFVDAYFPRMSSSSVVAVATREHAVVVSTLPHFTQNLELHDVGGNVRLLQEYLNDHGYLIAKTGPGSPGHETNTFGRHTLIALKEFQKANNIKVDGYFGWTTRQIVNEGLGVTNLQ